MMPQPIPFDRQLSVTLTAQEWNGIISLLQDVPVPYRVSAPLIAKVQEQLLLQTQRVEDVSSQD